MENKNKNPLIRSYTQSMKKIFSEKDPIAFFRDELSLKGSLYLEDLGFPNKILKELESYAVEMNYIVHLFEEGILILDPHFFRGDYE